MCSGWITGGKAISGLGLTRCGSLDGLTILRYARAYESGGGVERYLADLNAVLAERNRLVTLQMHLTDHSERLAETEHQIGSSRLVKVPLLAARRRTDHGGARRPSLQVQFKSWVRDCFLTAPGVYPVITRRLLANWRPPRRDGEPTGAGSKCQDLLSRFRVDLVVLHAGGGRDTWEIARVAAAARVPVALVHHFSNDRLSSLSMRQLSEAAVGVAGVCGVSVPHYLQSRFQNVSDGIDVAFFRREKATPVCHAEPVLLLPARITPTKGQQDLLRIAQILHARGLRTRIVLAGRVDSPQFECELRKQIAEMHMEDRVEMAGALGDVDLRNWYASAAVLVFPTYHHEGLPRILLESQAMEVPPVVYEIGGTREGLVDRQTGFLVPAGDVAAMANAVEHLLRDRSLAAGMAQAGRAFVHEQFSLAAMAGRHESFYRMVLSARRSKPA